MVRRIVYSTNLLRSASPASVPTLSRTKSPSDADGFTRLVRGIEGDVLDQTLHHRHQPPRADILDARIDLNRSVGDGLDRVRGEIEGNAPRFPSGRTYCLISEASVSLRMRMKSSRVSALSSTRIGRRPCSSGKRSDGLAVWEGAGGDEQDVVGLDRPVFGRDRCAFDQGQKVPLHALTGDVAAAALARERDLVDLVEEDDAMVFDQRHPPRL